MSAGEKAGVLTPYRRWVLGRAQHWTEQADGFCPQGSAQWAAIRVLEADGLVVSVGWGAMEDQSGEDEHEIFAITDAGRYLLAEAPPAPPTPGGKP